MLLKYLITFCQIRPDFVRIERDRLLEKLKKEEKIIPPKAGLAIGLHLMMVSSVFLIPKERANFRNKPFTKNDSRTALIK